jgi:hypothetical protein
VLTGRSFFPHLISAPFRHGLHEAFAFAIVACLIAAVASFSRGRHQRPDAVGMPDRARLGLQPAATAGPR